jgi:DNA polymerase-1
MANQEKKLIIIDSNSVIHRAYHALPPLTTKKGELVNAVYGFLLVFLKAIKDFRPDYIAAAFDLPAPTFRHKKFKEYKAKRPPAPEELYQQIPKVKEVLGIFNVQVFEKEGYEADDIICTIAGLSLRKQILPKIEIIILSGDTDNLQLVNPQTKVYVLRKGVKDTVLYNEILVKEKYQGLSPKQLLDFKALRGDPSDNIPGVTGVGEKTAIRLLLQFGNLENLYKEIEENSEKVKEIKQKLKEKLIKYKEQAFISKDLANLQKNVPIDFSLEKCRWAKYEKEKVIQSLKNLEFYSLIKRLPTNEGQEENLTGGNLKLW